MGIYTPQGRVLWVRPTQTPGVSSIGGLRAVMGRSQKRRRKRSEAERSSDQALFERALEDIERLGAGADRDSEPVPERQAEYPARFVGRVARGQIEIGGTLDLHGLDREGARERLRSFLSAQSGESVLIIHGKGRGILAEEARRELDRHPRVAEHLEAPPALGGSGARVARLRRRR